MRIEGRIIVRVLVTLPAQLALNLASVAYEGGGAYVPVSRSELLNLYTWISISHPSILIWAKS
jgi:hypothetical protein